MILEKDSFPKNEFIKRIQNHQREIEESNIDFSIIQYKSDLYYYSGTGQSCILVIPKEGDAILFGRRDIARIKQESFLDHVIQIRRTSEIYNHLQDRGLDVKGGKFGLEGDILPAEMYQKSEKIFHEKSALSVGPLLRKIRSIKSEREINVLKESARILDEIHSMVPDIIEEGMTEIEASVKLYTEMRIRGAQPTVRSRDFYTETGGIGLVLSGNNTGISSYTLTATAGPGLHQSNPLGPSFKKIKQGELIFVDFSLAYKGYITDETRCYVIGKAPELIKERYQKAWELEEFMYKIMREGKQVSEIYQQTYKFAKEQRIEKDLMLGGQIPFLGHGVGLELSEPPIITSKSDYRLVEGNVIALEPKLIYPNEMVIGSENTYVIRKNNSEQITNAPQPLLE
ncbi:MAG: aminopeptidase P family protein [Candidatus Heimdallarchaeota archaeon]|nr:aminopeptidase P family protein [Candidatus Heimdallarchaeota archaeon]